MATKTKAPKSAASEKQAAFASKYQASVPKGGIPFPIITPTTRGKFRVRTPAGFDGELAEIRGGVITFDHPFYHYWQGAFGETDAAAPDCMTIDGVQGVGTPGGECATCPFKADYTCKGYHAAYMTFAEGLQVQTAQGTTDVVEPGKSILLRVPATSRPALNAFILEAGGDPRVVEAVCTIGSTDTRTRKGIVAVEFTPGRKVPTKHYPMIEAAFNEMQGQGPKMISTSGSGSKALPQQAGGTGKATPKGWG